MHPFPGFFLDFFYFEIEIILPLKFIYKYTLFLVFIPFCFLFRIPKIYKLESGVEGCGTDGFDFFINNKKNFNTNFASVGTAGLVNSLSIWL